MFTIDKLKQSQTINRCVLECIFEQEASFQEVVLKGNGWQDGDYTIERCHLGGHVCRLTLKHDDGREKDVYIDIDDVYSWLLDLQDKLIKENTMTNKIKPFCVDTKSENLSNEQIKQLHKWCIDIGANVFEDVECWILCKNDDPLMGIDYDNDIIARPLDGFSCYDNNIIKFKDVPSHLGLVDSEKSILIETSVSTSDNFYTKLDTLLTLYPITLSKVDTEAPVDIIITHDDFEHDFIVKNEEELLELVEAFDTLDKLSGK